MPAKDALFSVKQNLLLRVRVRGKLLGILQVTNSFPRTCVSFLRWQILAPSLELESPPSDAFPSPADGVRKVRMEGRTKEGRKGI